MWTTWMLLSACLAGQVTSSEVPEHPFRKDYEYNANERLFFKIHAQERSWGDAVAVCRGEGAELAYPRAPTASLVTRDRAEAIWLGAQARNVVVIAEENLNDQTDDYAIFLSPDGAYGRRARSDLLAFECMKSENDMEVDETCGTTIPGYNLGPDGKSCYKVHTIPLSWRQAHTACKAEYAHLAVINSQSEAEHVVGMTDDVNEIAVGFHDLVVKGTFETIFAEDLKDSGYAVWTPEAQEHQAGTCGLLRRDKTLQSASCDEQVVYVCETRFHTLKDF